MDQTPQQLFQHHHHFLLSRLLYSPFVEQLLFGLFGQDISLGLKEFIPLAQVPVEFSLEAA